MDAAKLINALKAEIVAGRALAWVNRERLVVARLVDGTMTLTDDGKRVAEMLAQKSKTRATAKKADTEPPAQTE